MNANSLTISAGYALFFGLSLIFLKLQLLGLLWLIVMSSCVPLLRYWQIRQLQKVRADAHKTNETLFDEKIALVTSVVMLILGIGMTYILLNRVIGFQPHDFDCGASNFGRSRAPSFECAERLVLTAIYGLTYLSLIAGMWSMARRYVVREHWHDLQSSGDRSKLQDGNHWAMRISTQRA